MVDNKTTTRFDDLLFERERVGVQTLTYVRGMFLLFLVISHWLVGVTLFEKIAASFVTAIGLVIIVSSLFFLGRQKFVSQIGLLGSLFDIGLVIILPIIWYVSVGGAETPPAFILKTQITIMTLGLVILNGLALRPLYPIVVAVGGIVVHISFLIFVLIDPRTRVSSNFLDSGMGPALSVEFVVTSMLIIGLAGGAMGYITYLARQAVDQGVKLEVTNAHLGRYFSPGVVAKISDDVGSLTGIGGRKQNVAVLFCDIRNFTTLTEEMDPTEVVNFLSDYHSNMVKVIFEFGGTIDKFIGDAIMVTFGTPDPAKDDAERAVRTGLAMNKALIAINKKRLGKSQPSISHGIGVHFGPVIAGNIGTEERLEYTVIGDTVNVASRIQDACKIVGEPFLISEAVKEKLPEDIVLKALPEQFVKGRQAPVQIFAVLK